MLQLGTKCFNAQGSNYSSCTCRSSEKYVAAVEAHKKNERQGWNSVYHQNWWFSEFHTPLMVMYFFASFLAYDQTQGSGGVLVLLHG